MSGSRLLAEFKHFKQISLHLGLLFDAPLLLPDLDRLEHKLKTFSRTELVEQQRVNRGVSVQLRMRCGVDLLS
jgi:hypothetical protein